MEAQALRRQFWIGWLLVASAGVAAFGLSLVLLPGISREAFSLLVYASRDRIDAFGAEQVRYIALVHAVLGGVMVGWGSFLYFAVKEFLQPNHPRAWSVITVSLLAWFIPDTRAGLRTIYPRVAPGKCCWQGAARRP